MRIRYIPITTKQRWTRQGVTALCLVLLMAISSQVSVSAKKDEDFYALNDIIYYDPDFVCNLQASTTAGGGAANIGVDKGFSLGKDPKERRVNLAKAFMKDYGLTAEQASGIVGNIMREGGGQDIFSDYNERLGIAGDGHGPPRLVIPGVNTGGYGWVQWTGSRKTEFVNYAVKNGYVASANVSFNDAANYAFLKYELTGAYKSSISALKTKSSPSAAAVSFEATFESAGVPANAERIKFAEQVFSEINGGGGSATGGSSGTASSTGGGTGNCGAPAGGVAGDKAFPLKTTKAKVESQNPGMFKNGTTNKAGHPYTAFDILADDGTEVVAFMSGTVVHLGHDRCTGQLIGIYNKESNMIVSYLHNSTAPGSYITEGTVVKPGDHVAVVGSSARSCGIPHLHIDAAQGDSRPGCSRLGCSSGNAAQYIDIGPDLFKTHEALP
jgi:murein DD-endopeptidase MepM/ murein hydrolase activator NlpD